MATASIPAWSYPGLHPPPDKQPFPAFTTAPCILPGAVSLFVPVWGAATPVSGHLSHFCSICLFMAVRGPPLQGICLLFSICLCYGCEGAPVSGHLSPFFPSVSVMAVRGPRFGASVSLWLWGAATPCFRASVSIFFHLSLFFLEPLILCAFQQAICLENLRPVLITKSRKPENPVVPREPASRQETEMRDTSCSAQTPEPGVDGNFEVTWDGLKKVPVCISQGAM